MTRGLAVYCDDGHSPSPRKGKLRNSRKHPHEPVMDVRHRHTAGPRTAATEEKRTRTATARRRGGGAQRIVETTCSEAALQSEGTFSRPRRYEVIAHLVEKYFKAIWKRPCARPSGRHRLFAGVISRSDRIRSWPRARDRQCDRNRDNEYFVASDVPAILSHTRDMFFLADGDMASSRPRGAAERFRRAPVNASHTRSVGPIMAERALQAFHAEGNLRAAAPCHTPGAWAGHGRVFLDEMDIAAAEFARFRQVKIIACARAARGSVGKL